MELLLHRATGYDIDQIVQLAYKSFGMSDMMHVDFGPDSPLGHGHMKRRMLDFFNDPADTLICIRDRHAKADVKIIDEKSGEVVSSEQQTRILCVADWKIFPQHVREKPPYGHKTSEGGKRLTGSDMQHVEDPVKRDDAAEVLNTYLDRRREQEEAHVFLHLLFTDPEFQGKGLGRMMMDWGNNLADSLMVSSWVEASKAGKKLYQDAGYVPGHGRVVENKSWKIDWLPMRRPQKNVIKNLVLK